MAGLIRAPAPSLARGWEGRVWGEWSPECPWPRTRSGSLAKTHSRGTKAAFSPLATGCTVLSTSRAGGHEGGAPRTAPHRCLPQGARCWRHGYPRHVNVHPAGPCNGHASLYVHCTPILKNLPLGRICPIQGWNYHFIKTQALKCREACQVTEHPFFKETRFPEEQPWLESTSS